MPEHPAVAPPAVADPTPHLLAALRPRSLRDRARLLLTHGYTAVQVYERLPAEVQRDLADGADDPTAAARRAVDRVHRALVALAARGGVRRRRETYSMILNTKGERGMVVDVWRLP